VVRKADGALIGRYGLMDMAVEVAASEGAFRRGWFGREEAPAGVSLIFECELGYTFDRAVWGQGYASETAACVRDYARDGLGLDYVVSAILPGNAQSRRVAERGGRAGGRADGGGGAYVRSVGVGVACHRRIASVTQRCDLLVSESGRGKTVAVVADSSSSRSAAEIL
jgi:hypothetical protein